MLFFLQFTYFNRTVIFLSCIHNSFVDSTYNFISVETAKRKLVTNTTKIHKKKFEYIRHISKNSKNMFRLS